MVVRLTKIISHEENPVDGARFVFFRPTVRVLCISSLCSKACKSKHRSLSCSPPYSHTITYSVEISPIIQACKVRLGIRAATQRDSKTTTARVQSSYLRVCSQVLSKSEPQTAVPSLFPASRFFNPPNLTIKLVFPCEGKSLSLCSDVTPTPTPD